MGDARLPREGRRLSAPAGGGKRDGGLLRDAGAVGSATLASRVLGLVREQVFAFLFGAGNATDAFQIAFRIPNLLRDLFAEGAMSASLVPTFTRMRKEGGERRAWLVASRVFRTLFAIVTVLSLLGILFSEELVGVYASAYRDVPGKFELTVSMTRVLFLFFPFVCLAAAFMAVLNASGVFFLPAFASALFNFSSIVTGVLCAWAAPRFGREPIEGMAVGVVFGGIVQAFCQWPKLRAIGYRAPARLPEDPPLTRDPALRSMLLLMVPGTLGLAATQINLLVNSALATGEGSGAVSWLAYAFRLMQFPIGVFGVSLAVVALSRVSRHWVEGDLPAFQGTLSRALRQTFAVNLPASAGLAALGIPIIWLLYGYGRFTPEDARATAAALAAYSVGLAAYSAVKVLVPVCYAMGRARIAVFSSVLSVGVNLALNLLLVDVLGFWGLALGTSLTAYVNLGFLLFAVRKAARKRGIEAPFEGVLPSCLASFALSFVMGAACFGLALAWEEAWGWPDSALGRSLQVLGLMSFGVLVYYGFARVFKVSDVLETVDFPLSKIRSKWEHFRNGR